MLHFVELYDNQKFSCQLLFLFLTYLSISLSLTHICYYFSSSFLVLYITPTIGIGIFSTFICYPSNMLEVCLNPYFCINSCLILSKIRNQELHSCVFRFLIINKCKAILTHTPQYNRHSTYIVTKNQYCRQQNK